jgi:sugar phosphate isomerase/epimerase
VLSKRFHWGLSTLGCPELSFEAASQLAANYGIGALELRALENQIDLLALWRNRPPPLKDWQSFLAARAQRIVMLDTPCVLLGDRDDWETLMEYARWAERLNVPYLRVFDGGKIGMVLNHELNLRATAYWEKWQRFRETECWNTDLLIETHDIFCDSNTAVQWLQQLTKPPGLVWDVHHTWRYGKEDVAVTWSRLERYVRHIHVKDSLPAKHSVEFVLPGQGDVPFEILFELLDNANFSHVVSFEWEKWWRPGIAPLEQCLEACIKRRW